MYKVQWRINRGSRKKIGRENIQAIRKHSQQYSLPAYRIILNKESANRTSQLRYFEKNTDQTPDYSLTSKFLRASLGKISRCCPAVHGSDKYCHSNCVFPEVSVFNMFAMCSENNNNKIYLLKNLFALE